MAANFLRKALATQGMILEVYRCEETDCLHLFDKEHVWMCLQDAVISQALFLL